MFADHRLRRLYKRGENAAKWPSEVIQAFLRRVRHVEAAQDERDLRTPPSVHYEQLRGRYTGKASLRLNRQWRLILSIEEDSQGKHVVIHEITNHYGD